MCRKVSGMVILLASLFACTLIPSCCDAAASSLTVSVADTIGLNIAPTSASGNFAHSSTSDNTVSVSTDNYTGYTLGIAASSNDSGNNTLNYKENNVVVDTINSHSITAGVSATNYANDSYASSNSLNNTWGYRPSTYYDTVNNTNVDNTSTNLYFPAPTSTSVTTLAKTTTANPSAADNYNIAIGVRIGADKAPGAYTNTMVITVVANPVIYTVTYHANAGDDNTVANMPTDITNGLSYANTINLDNPASPTIPTRTGYTFIGWCTSNTSQTSCESDGTSSSTDGTLYNTANNNLASFPIDRTNSSNNIDVHAIWSANQYACTKQYRLQNADGTFPTTGGTNDDGYTVDTTEQVNYGATCTYTKSVMNYKDNASGTNGASATTSGTMTANGLTLSLDFYRNTYDLTVTAGANTSDATGSGTYRWGQSVTVGVTKATNTTCTSYATPTWTATAGTAPSAGTSVSYTMPGRDATVTATSTVSNIAQTITLSKGTGVSGINIAGTNYTGASVSLNCGTYGITGIYNSGYGFSSWARANGVDLTSTSTATTNMTITGAGTLTLNGKSNINLGYMQDLSLTTCSQATTDGYAAYDRRDGKEYSVKYINGECWMTQNLRYLGDTGSAAKTMTIGNSNSNVSNKSITLYSLNSSNAGNFNAYSNHCDDSNGYNYACVYDSGSTTTGVWYNYYAASAGTISTNDNNTHATNDICPKNWHLPNGINYTADSDYSRLIGNNTSGWQSPTSGLAAFGAVAGGFYAYGTIPSTVYGRWWSASSNITIYRWSLDYRSSDGQFDSYNLYARHLGFFVRCVRSS